MILYIYIYTRFSINFFGYEGCNAIKLIDCYNNDEHELTVVYIQNKQFKNVLYSSFYVSHLSFFKQIISGIDLYDLIYNKIYNEN